MHRSHSRWLQRIFQFINRSLRWLIPGIGVKRWVAVILFGTVFLATGIAVLILDVYRTAPNTWWLPVLSAISLRFLDRTLRGLIFGGIGVGLVIFGIIKLNRTLLRPFVGPGQHVSPGRVAQGGSVREFVIPERPLGEGIDPQEQDGAAVVPGE